MKALAYWESFLADSDDFQDTAISELLHDQLGVKHIRHFIIVRFDAFHVMRLCGTQSLHKIVKLPPESTSYG